MGLNGVVIMVMWAGLKLKRYGRYLIFDGTIHSSLQQTRLSPGLTSQTITVRNLEALGQRSLQFWMHCAEINTWLEMRIQNFT